MNVTQSKPSRTLIYCVYCVNGSYSAWTTSKLVNKLGIMTPLQSCGPEGVSHLAPYPPQPQLYPRSIFCPSENCYVFVALILPMVMDKMCIQCRSPLISINLRLARKGPALRHGIPGSDARWHILYGTYQQNIKDKITSQAHVVENRL